jgi:hypothetical protein
MGCTIAGPRQAEGAGCSSDRPGERAVLLHGQRVVSLFGGEYAKLITKPGRRHHVMRRGRHVRSGRGRGPGESLYAAALGTQVLFRDQLVLNGKKSQYKVWVSDPGSLDPSATPGVLIVSLSGSENEMTYTRGDLDEMPRVPA